MIDNALNPSALLANLENNLRQEILARQLANPIMIGLHSGGAWLAEQLHKNLAIEEPLGLMDISFYRDDFLQGAQHSDAKPSQLPAHVEGKDIILIDDVIYTGRTSRAALNEIFDYGRPNQVLFGVLVERTGRQIPLQPDCVGGQIDLPAEQRIKLTGPSPLAIHIHLVEKD